VRRGLFAVAIAVGLLAFAAPTVDAKRVHGIPVPGKAKPVDGVYTSRLTFRRTVSYYARYLKARKIAHTAVPVYRYRGVVVARWVATDPKSTWAAIHVFHRRSKTRIFIVPARQQPKKP